MLQSLGNIVNEEYEVLEEKVEAYGKEEGGEQGRGSDKIEDQQCVPMCVSKSMSSSLFWMSFSTIEGVYFLTINVLGLKLTSKTNIIVKNVCTEIISTN